VDGGPFDDFVACRDLCGTALPSACLIRVGTGSTRWEREGHVINLGIAAGHLLQRLLSTFYAGGDAELRISSLRYLW